jgi:long-chain acyl-CoA synthetase
MLWPLLERFVARRVLAGFGGRLRVAVSGGAALPIRVAQFLVGLGLPLVEGYGLTEAGPVVTTTTIEDSLPGSVGRPLYGLDVRLGEQSELIVRSPAVMQGYWQNEQATAQALSPDGWLRTGDIAEIRNGRIFITGRLKEILVLSTGEHVAPSAVEAAIQNDPLFEQVCVIGDQRPCVVAILVLNRERWLLLARDLAIDRADLNVSVATDAILSRISAQTRSLPPIWQVRAILVTTTPWTIGDGSLTPTLKVKRRVIEERFKEQIDSLYSRVAQQRQSVASRRRG